MNEQNRVEQQIVGERIWLEYFNKYALAEGVITEQEFRAIQSKIIKRESEQKNKHHVKGR